MRPRYLILSLPRHSGTLSFTHAACSLRGRNASGLGPALFAAIAIAATQDVTGGNSAFFGGTGCYEAMAALAGIGRPNPVAIMEPLIRSRPKSRPCC